MLRPLVLVLILVGGFYLYTTQHPGSLKLSFAQPEKLELTEAAGPQTLDPEEQVNVGVYKKAIPSVVNIRSRAVTFNFFYGVVPEEGQGSGFILDKEGHILTNFHVIKGADKIEVTLHNKRTYPAKVIGVDRGHDLAVIQINAPDLVPATLGDSRNLVVGQKVFAIGNPFGLAGTMTRGIISSIRPVGGPNGNTIDEAIQTDAAINPGNSGGPLLNSKAEVIGINSMIATGGAEQSAGIGFAIPINTAKAVLNDLVTEGRVRRPSLGIEGLPIGPELADEMGLAADYGVLIVRTVPGGAAAKAGLRGGNQQALLGNTPILLGGDLIVAIDGQRIEDMQDLSRVMNNHRAGDVVAVSVFRGKQRLDVKVVLGEARESAG
ncbi:MAG TPA: trypsin-like peptidase domain-containing protein [Terriglobales bacterium]|nr:trypsin-like peptidase domain-containing protein [Terriglobales bacterium]